MKKLIHFWLGFIGEDTLGKTCLATLVLGSLFALFLGALFVLSYISIGAAVLVFLIFVLLVLKFSISEINKDSYKDIQQSIDSGDLTVEQFKAAMKDGKLSFLNYSVLKVRSF